MQNPSVSPSDPVFWVLHCFYDLVWQKFIERNTNDGQSLLSTYPESDVYPLHRSLSLMPLTIGGALNARFLLGKHIVRYAARPTCSSTNGDNGCTSTYLECDRKAGVCRPTLRVCDDEEGPNLETFCDSINCTSDWKPIEITIRADFLHEKPQCYQLCSNAVQLNVYSHGQRQQTVLLDDFGTNQTGIRLKVMTKPGLTSKLYVRDSCARQCDCYFLTEGKYTACDQKAIYKWWRVNNRKDLLKQPTGGSNRTLFAFECGVAGSGR